MDDQYKAEELTSTMQDDDKATLERLKAKWSSGADQTAIRPPQSGEDSLANMRICQVCQGSGLQTEVYEYRRMEHTCTHCRGEGLLFLGGRQHPSTAAPIRNSKPQQQQHDSKQQSSKNKVRPSPAWLQKLQEKIAVLSQEASDLQADLDSPGSEEQQLLQTQLLKQLQDHLQQLKAKHSLALSGSSDSSRAS